MALLNAELIIPGDHDETIHYAVEHFLTVARDAIQDHEAFYVALSGGSTPREIYELLCKPPQNVEIEWDKVHLFWSDERAVASEHSDSNFHMAMKSGFSQLDILPEHIHRMEAEKDIEKNALKYERQIRKVLQNRSFDLVMLGMGDDGHTASLFPETSALDAKGHLVVANFVPQKNSWRMTMTLDCINAASNVAVYVLGEAKKEMLYRVMNSSPALPCQLVGTPDKPALWIADEAAASLLANERK